MAFLRKLTSASLLVTVILAAAHVANGQVSPAEITKPELKRLEQTNFQQLIEMNRAISSAEFPFSVVLSRYPGLDPKEQLGSDKRGLEFVDFEGRIVLKISANYNAAFDAQSLTGNQRANRVLDEVVTPILEILPKYFSPKAEFEGVGLEISYHVRTVDKSFTYEGKEVLAVVFDKEDAFKYPGLSSDSARQEILDNSEIFEDGKPFGLMLGQRDAMVREDSESPKSTRKASQARPPSTAIPEATPGTTNAPAVRIPDPMQEFPAAMRRSKTAAPAEPEPATNKSPATQADADALQVKLQSQLQALNTEGQAHDFLVDYAPPSFAVFRNQIYLQLTLRNRNIFDPGSTSIYKRAARSFDLFLAPLLKDLLSKTPNDPAIAGLDITVLTQFSAKAAASSEAIEFACPIGPLRGFANADITNQDLISQSAVLVNGVRIALNLQQVE